MDGEDNFFANILRKELENTVCISSAFLKKISGLALKFYNLPFIS